MIGPKSNIAPRVHRVTLQNPGPAIPNGDGGYTQTWTDLAPASMNVSIERASVENLERMAAGTLIASATHIIEGPYHPQVTTQTRVLFNGRSFSVKAVQNRDEINVDLRLACEEVIA
jgi:SPP1 family predicted phage head-tail adaptor